MNISIGDKKGELSLYYIFSDGSSLLNSGIEVESSLKSLREDGEFTGKTYELSYINNIDKKEKILFLGLGEKSQFNNEILRRANSKAIRFASDKNIKSLSIECNGEDKEDIYSGVKAIAESSILTSYKYDKYLSDKIDNSLEDIYINSMEDENLEKALKEGISLGKSTNIARDLVNQPANFQRPEDLGRSVEELGKKFGFEVELFNEEEIIGMKMDSLYQVGKGSHNKPTLIVMRYMGNPDSREKLGLIGKGVTFDSGGLNLKSGPRFIHMKHDVAGAAAVIGAMCSIAGEGLETNVIGVIGAAENLISSNGYKPGDVISSMAGKSILIKSTDAEGRLTLIDSIHYAIEKENVDKVVNIATLTGSSRRIFGNYGGIVMSNNEEFYKKLETSSEISGERTLRLPIVEEAKEHLKSDVADYINSSQSDTCGSITAGMFIREFVQDKPWIHLDMSGPCWSDSKEFYVNPGGTGWGTRLLYSLVKEL